MGRNRRMLWNMWGFVAQISGRTVLPFPQTDLSHGFCDSDAKGGLAVQDRDAHLHLGDPSAAVGFLQSPLSGEAPSRKSILIVKQVWIATSLNWNAPTGVVYLLG